MVSGSYVPLDGRVKGACRCSQCSSDVDIQKWYENDLICRFDGGLCYDEGVCVTKRRVYVGSVKGKACYRLMNVKCSRCSVKF